MYIEAEDPALVDVFEYTRCHSFAVYYIQCNILISNPQTNSVNPKCAPNLQKDLWSLIFWMKTEGHGFFSLPVYDFHHE